MSHPPKSGPEALDDSMMTSVPKDLFFEGMQLPVTIYFKMNRHSYIVIGKRGDRASFSNYHSFNNPNFRIFVRNIDHNALIDYVTEMTSKIVSQKAIPAVVKTKFLTGLVDDTITSFEPTGFTSVGQLQKVSKMIMELNEAATSFTDIMGILSELPEGEAKHSMATCMISLILAEEMQITLRAAQEKIALGALLHDVGLKFVPREVLDKPRHLWTPEDLAQYEQHPMKGVEMLRDVKDISNDVLLIVAEHHENSQGTGFPKKLRDVKISPLGRIVILANYFANLLFSPQQGVKRYTADEAVTYIEDILGQPFHRPAFMALKNTINKKNLQDKVNRAS